MFSSDFLVASFCGKPSSGFINMCYNMCYYTVKLDRNDYFSHRILIIILMVFSLTAACMGLIYLRLGVRAYRIEKLVFVLYALFGSIMTIQSGSDDGMMIIQLVVYLLFGSYLFLRKFF